MSLKNPKWLLQIQNEFAVADARILKIMYVT